MQRFSTPGRRGGRGSNGNFRSPYENQSPKSDHYNNPNSFHHHHQMNNSQSPSHHHHQHWNNHNHQQHNFNSGKKKRSHSDGIEAYFKPSMLENPWAKLEEKMKKEQELNA